MLPYKQFYTNIQLLTILPQRVLHNCSLIFQCHHWSVHRSSSLYSSTVHRLHSLAVPIATLDHRQLHTSTATFHTMTQSLEQAIIQKLTDTFHPVHLQVMNERYA